MDVGLTTTRITRSFSHIAHKRVSLRNSNLHVLKETNLSTNNSPNSNKLIVQYIHGYTRSKIHAPHV